jgi:phosphoglycolate phosphatase
MAMSVKLVSMGYDTYCFDLDGTLWDAIDGTLEAWNRIGERYELRETPISRADLEATTGRPIDECVTYLFGGPAEGLIAEIEAEEARCISSDNVCIYPGVAEALAVLSGGARLSIVSNCQSWYLDRFFEISNLQVHFKEWDCHGSSGEPKGVMIRNLTVGKTLYIGDTITDQHAAREADVDFAFAAYGFGKSDDYDLYLSEFTGLLTS